jgi:D-alanyl-D-alanine carboxypeptidase
MAGPSLLFEPASGRIITQDRAGEPWYPASLTKLMTAYLIFEDIKAGKLQLKQQIPVSEYAQSMPASKIGMKAGQTISVDLALQSMLVYSANDMAVVLAEAASVDVAQFVTRMNQTAGQLGMSATRFKNPNGLRDPGQISTARDLAVLASAILTKYPEQRHYFSQKYVSIGKIKLRNRNMLLRQMANADGMKTGFVCTSGFNLIATAQQDGRELMAVVLGADSAKGRANWAQELLTQGFARPLSNGRVRDIRNHSGAVPFDMTAEVCRGRSGVKLVSAIQLKGHGISLGRYRSRADADRVLQARAKLLETDENARRGIVRLADVSGYGVYVWNLDAAKAQALCGALEKAQAWCEVIKPEQFAAIAAKAPKKKPAAKPQKATP